MSLKKTSLFSVLGAMLSVVSCVVASCSSDDEEFTSSASTQITFSADTISFDTVFTTIGSATKIFKIYNPNSKGVRFTSVRLGSDGSSGFRVNLDGQYGTQFTDVEVYHEDSLFCFVEVTVNPHDSDSPILITDSLLFSVENGRTFSVQLQAWGQDVVMLHAPVFTSATDTLTATRPVVVTDSLVVGPGATLTIAAGTTLCFHKGAGVSVHGTIVCDGTQERPIILRGDRTDKLFPYLPYDRLDAQWEGIRLHPESYGNRFTHCDIHGGNYGIVAETSDPQQAKCNIESCILHNVAGPALYLFNTKAEIANTQISNALGGCATVIGGNTLFTHCTLAQFYPWSAQHAPALQFANVADEKEYPLQQIEFRNCIITGYSDDEVYGSRMQDSDAAFNYMFRNCLVNTVISDDIAEYFPGCMFDQDTKEKETDEADDTPTPRRESNFVTIDTENFYYDFRLDSLSAARKLADPTYSVGICTTDMLGTQRPAEHPDAGCYQSTF